MLKGLRVVILESAEHDLRELRSYIIKNFSISTWRNSYSSLKKTIRHLQHFPQAGTIPEEIEKLNLTQYRQVLSGVNRIIYERRQDVVYIHIIADSRTELLNLLTRRLLRNT